jgi:hypothetical protein
MRYLFSQDSGTQIEFITERWFHFSGQKHGQGTRDPDVPLGKIAWHPFLNDICRWIEFF